MDGYGMDFTGEVDGRIFDLRAEPKDQKNELRVQHPSSVINIRQVEDHLIIVGGLENSVSSRALRTDCSLRCMTSAT